MVSNEEDMVSESNFRGYPAFLEQAAKELGFHSELANAARHDNLLGAVATMCSQAESLAPNALDQVIRSAHRLVDLMQVAWRAAELMLVDTSQRRTRVVSSSMQNAAAMERLAEVTHKNRSRIVVAGPSQMNPIRDTITRD